MCQAIVCKHLDINGTTKQNDATSTRTDKLTDLNLSNKVINLGT